MKFRTGVLLPGLMALLTVAWTAPAVAEKITVKIGSGHSPSWHFIALTQNQFIPEVKKRVKEKTSHEIEFIENWSGSSVKTTEVLEAVGGLQIVPLPMPDPVHYAGQLLPASYANFYFTNAAVIVPTFNDPNDRVALGILAGKHVR